jgi:hypothetical protein
MEMRQQLELAEDDLETPEEDDPQQLEGEGEGEDDDDAQNTQYRYMLMAMANQLMGKLTAF